MAISRFTPPLDYLKEASNSSLESFELARLNHAANLRREIGSLIDQWVTETSEAMLARWMIDHRRTHQATPPPSPDLLQAFATATLDEFPVPPVNKVATVAPPALPSAPPRFADPRPTPSETPRFADPRPTPPVTPRYADTRPTPAPPRFADPRPTPAHLARKSPRSRPSAS